MAIGAILTLGLGDFGSVNLLPTLGLLSGSSSAENPHLTWGGPYLHWGHVPPRIRKKIPEEVREVIEEVAEQVDMRFYDAVQQKSEHFKQEALKAAILERGLAWKKVYQEALIELIKQQDEDEAVVTMLFSM